jgi:hypothetical protein
MLAFFMPLRPPAVPLVTIDPYTSCWSFADHLYDDWPRHWTGTEFALCGLVRVDGVPLRFMGAPQVLAQSAKQLALEVTATRTIYRFEAGPVELEVEFVSPLLLDDLELLSRPASYVYLRSRSRDGKAHDVRAYLDMTSQWAVNVPHQKVLWSREESGALAILGFRHELQPVLEKAGDDLRIDWGTALLAAPLGAQAIVGDIDYCRMAFIERGRRERRALLPMPRQIDLLGRGGAGGGRRCIEDEAVRARRIRRRILGRVFRRAAEGMVAAWGHVVREDARRGVRRPAAGPRALHRVRCAPLRGSRARGRREVRGPGRARLPAGDLGLQAGSRPPTAARSSSRRKTSATRAWERWTSITSPRPSSCTSTRIS